MCECVCVNLRWLVCARNCVCWRVSVREKERLCVHACNCLFLCVCLCVCVCVCLCVCLCVFVCVWACVACVFVCC